MAMPAERFITFHGSLHQPKTDQLRALLCTMINDRAQKVTLLFSSDGGSTEDGIALYTYIQSLPYELTMHAVGWVGSMAIPVFLAAPKRLASKNAAFFFHEYTWTQNGVITQTKLTEQDLLLTSAMLWTQGIVKATSRLTDADFEEKKLFDHPVLLTANDALQHGLVTQIAEPKIPAGCEPRIVT